MCSVDFTKMQPGKRPHKIIYNGFLNFQYKPRLSPVQLGQTKRPESSPMGKLSVLNIERPSSKDRNTALPTRLRFFKY